MAIVIFYGQFIEDKVGKNGLTVTVDVERITRSDGTRTAHVTGASAVEVTRRGLYYYRLTGADLTLYDYVATFITAYTDVDQREIAALWTLFSGIALGTGAITWPYTLKSTVDATPIADADIWVSTDEAQNNIVANGRTDAFGSVTFYLDAGTHYFWRQKSGWNFVNPDVEVVS